MNTVDKAKSMKLLIDLVYDEVQRTAPEVQASRHEVVSMVTLSVHKLASPGRVRLTTGDKDMTLTEAVLILVQLVIAAKIDQRVEAATSLHMEREGDWNFNAYQAASILADMRSSQATKRPRRVVKPPAVFSLATNSTGKCYVD